MWQSFFWKYSTFKNNVKAANDTNVFLTDYRLKISVTRVKRNVLNRSFDCESFKKPLQDVCGQVHVASLLVS